MKVKKPLRSVKIYEESCDFIHYVDNMHSFFENGLDPKRWTDVVVIALPIVCAELWELLLVIRYPGGLFNVLGYTDLQIFSCGLVSILSHKFTVDVLLSRQTTHTLIELRARIDFLLNKTHFGLKYNKWNLESLYESRYMFHILHILKKKAFYSCRFACRCGRIPSELKQCL